MTYRSFRTEEHEIGRETESTDSGGPAEATNALIEFPGAISQSFPGASCLVFITGDHLHEI